MSSCELLRPSREACKVINSIIGGICRNTKVSCFLNQVLAKWWNTLVRTMSFTTAWGLSSLAAFFTFLNFFLLCISCSTSWNCVLFVKLNCKRENCHKTRTGEKKTCFFLLLAVLYKAPWPVGHSKVTAWFLFPFLLLCIFPPFPPQIFYIRP